MTNGRHSVSARTVLAAAMMLLTALSLVMLLGGRPAMSHTGWAAVSNYQAVVDQAIDHGLVGHTQGHESHSNCNPGSCGGHAFMMASDVASGSSRLEAHIDNRAHAELTGMAAPPPQPPPKLADL